MTAAATAALPLEGLLPIPCCADGDRTLPDEVGRYAVRVCTLPEGHLDRDVPHRWQWATVEPAAPNGEDIC